MLTRIKPAASFTRPWIVCFSGALFFFYAFIQLNILNAISGSLVTAFSINVIKLGFFSSVYLWALTIFLIPAGLLFDLFSTRTLMLWAAFLGVLATCLFGLSSTLFAASVCRFFLGISHCFLSLGAFRLATRWYPAERRALVIGLILTVAMLGGMVAQTPVVLLTETIGWRAMLNVDALLGLVIVFFAFAFLYDQPVDYKAAKQVALAWQTIWTYFKAALSNLQNWLCGLYASFLNLPIMVLGALWGDMYLMQVHHLTSMQAANVTAMIFLGTIIGSPIAGFISDKIKLRRLPMIVGAIFSIIVVLYIAYVAQAGYTTLLWLFLVLGFITSAQVLTYPAIAELNPPHLTSTAMGLQSVVIMGGAAIAQPLFGWLMSLNWSGKIVGKTAIFSAANFQLAMVMLPIAFIIALIAAFIIRETHAKGMEA